MVTQLLGALATVYGVLGALKSLLQTRQMLARRSSGDVSAGFLASYAGGYAIWLAYGLSTGSLPLIVVDTVGLLCAGLTLAVALSLRGSLVRPATWNSGNTTPIPPRPAAPTPSPEERDGQHQRGVPRRSGGHRLGPVRAGGQRPRPGQALRRPRGGRGHRSRGAAGEIFAFLGPNGAGKTTTVEILEGFRQRTGVQVFVLGHDQGVDQPPASAVRPSVNPHSPVRHLGQEHLTVHAETWAREVLTPWQQAAAVTLVVKLPADTATDDHRTVIRDLTDARRRLDAGDWKGSVRASRDATEILRGMHAEHLNPRKTERSIDEREAGILDAERNLIQAFFDYGSATHADPGLRAITWTREHALLALATATAVAQRMFPAI